MLDFSVTFYDRFGEETPWFEGVAHTEDQIESHIRAVIQIALREGRRFTDDIIKVYMDNRLHYQGSIEEFMGKAALKKMGL